MTETNQSTELPAEEKETTGDVARTFLIAVILTIFFRTFLFEPFNIPSGSMVPTLLVGDYLFVSKYSYGYSKYSFPFGLGGFDGRIMAEEPKRGDVVVFRLPTETRVDFIKRLVGMPGDTVQVINGRLYLNDEIVERKPVGIIEYEKDYGEKVKVTEYIETLPGGIEHHIYEESDNAQLDNTEKFHVPSGHYFMMGDNRDNSRDSRVAELVGYVPYDNFVGKAEIMFFSTNGTARIYEFWKWPWTIRYNRLFSIIGDGESLKKNS